MAYSEGQLNGAADYRVGIEINYSGTQDWGANTSAFHWYVWFQNPTSYGSWSGSTQYWSANIGGVGYSGGFTVGYNDRNTTTRLIAAGTTWHGHDSNGFRPGFASSAYVDTDHSNIGDGGSGDAYVDAPRIPKNPQATGAPVASNIKPTEVTFTWTASADNMGAGIDQNLLRIHTVSPADSAGYTDIPLGGGVLSHTVTGLKPGTQYYAVVYAHNSRGYAPKSAQTAVKTMSGAYVWNGSEWTGSEVLVRNASNTAWVSGEVQARKASAWELAS